MAIKPSHCHRLKIERRPISEEEFWDGSGELLPLLRLGYSDGPGAVLTSEPCALRCCTVAEQEDHTYSAFAVLENADGKPEFFELEPPLTVHEFKSWADRAMPGVGVCSWGWGADLLDDHGNLRSDLDFPIRRE
jgi:hypothetical protein